MHCLKIVCWYSTVRPSGNQRSVKYGTEIIPSNMVRFLKWTLRSVIVRVELNWHSSLLMVTCPASRAFFAAWLLAFPKSFRGDEWSIKIFNSSQNFIFARLDDLLAKFKPVLACSCSQNSCSCSHVFVRIRKERSQEEQPYRTLLYRHECFTGNLDCKTVRIFAYSSAREQSNKRSGAKLRLARDSYATLYRFLYWFWEKNRLFCSLLENIILLKTTSGTRVVFTCEFIDDVISVITLYYFIDVFLSR